jgi:hypothetical protein
MNQSRLIEFRSLTFLVKLIVTLCSILTTQACSTETSSIGTFPKTPKWNVPSNGSWDLAPQSAAQFVIKERLFGIWKTTTLTMPLSGHIELSDYFIEAEVVADLTMLKSDSSQRDRYLLEKVFSSDESRYISCKATQQKIDFSADLSNLRIVFNCKFRDVSAKQVFKVLTLDTVSRQAFSAQTRISLDDYSVPDISQDPLVKVSRFGQLSVDIVLKTQTK